MPTKKSVSTATKTASKAALRAERSALEAKREALKAKAARLGGYGSGFMNFIREQGVVGLAVGLAIGTAAGDTVKKMVEAFINPLVQLIVGSQQGLQTASYTLQVGERQGIFLWGAFVSSLISLLATAFVVYLVIHFMKLDRLDKKKD